MGSFPDKLYPADIFIVYLSLRQSHFALLAGLELTRKTKLTSNLLRSACLYHPVGGTHL